MHLSDADNPKVVGQWGTGMILLRRFRGGLAAISNVCSKNPDRAVELWRDTYTHVFVHA